MLILLLFFCEHSDKGLVPTIPDDCPQILRDIMTMCWKQDPNERPVSFSDPFVFVRTRNNDCEFNIFFDSFSRILNKFV
jgi:hypothetical protein